MRLLYTVSDFFPFLHNFLALAVDGSGRGERLSDSFGVEPLAVEVDDSIGDVLGQLNGGNITFLLLVWLN